MGYGERNVWAGMIVGVLVVGAYLAYLLVQLSHLPASEVAWQWPMVWTVAAGIVGTIVLSIGWGIVAGIRDRDELHRLDQRDTDIERMGNRVGQAFMAIGGVGAIVLAMVKADWFWIGNALFFAFFLSALVGGIAQAIAYRRGLV